MKTILHIGAQKTGTTALQGSLAASHVPLREQGVLYPLSESYGPPQHAFLTLPIRTGSRMPRVFNRYTPQERQCRYEQLLSDINTQIATYRPKALVLSSEFFFSCNRPGDRGPFVDTLAKIQASEVNIVAYVRRFSDQYRSDLQQYFRHSSIVLAPKAKNLQLSLEFYFRLFGRDHVRIYPFDRRKMVDGDILYDFADKHLVPLGVDPDTLISAGSMNTSLSAEGFDIQRMFRRDFYPDKENVPMKPSASLFKALLKIDKEIGAPRPRLRDAIAHAVDHGSLQPLWMRDQLGIEFEGIDYRRLESKGPTPVEKRDYELAELVEMDREVQAEIFRHLEDASWAKQAPEFGEWIRERLAELQAGTPG